MRIVKIVLLYFSFSTCVWAQSKSSLTFTAWDDWPAWQKIAQFAEQSFQKGGYTNSKHSFADPGKDNKTAALVRFLKNGPGQMKDEGKEVISKWADAPGDSKILYLIDHGTVVNFGSDDGGQTGVKFPDSSKLSFQEISRIVQNSKKPQQKMKILASQCFSGGVHDIAVENSNVCSLSATSKEDVYLLSEADLSPFDKAVLTQVQNKGSLFSAYAAGLATDSANEGGAELSSMYYANKVLKKDKQESEPGRNTNLDFYFAKLSNAIQDCQDGGAGEGMGIGFFAMMPDSESPSCPGQKSNVGESMRDINEALAKIASSKDIHFELSPEDYKTLPAGHQKLYDTVVKINRPHFDKYQKVLKEKIETMAELRQLWADKQKAYKQCIGKRGVKTCDGLFKHELRSTNATIRKQLKEIKESIPEIVKFSKMVGGMKTVAQALRKGSPEQVTKLKNLLACENEAL